MSSHKIGIRSLSLFLFCFLLILASSANAQLGETFLIQKMNGQKISVWDIKIDTVNQEYSYKDSWKRIYTDDLVNLEQVWKNSISVYKKPLYFTDNRNRIPAPRDSQKDHIASIDKSLAQISKDFHVLYIIEIASLIATVFLALLTSGA